MAYRFEEFARAGRVVVFAGAGVSAGKSLAALPGWRQLNEGIVGSAADAAGDGGGACQDWLKDVALRVGGLA